MQFDRHAGRRSHRLGMFLAATCLAAVGCAHHRADQYAFAPPYAPPVYPQPQAPGAPAPVAYAAGPGAAPVVTMGAPAPTFPTAPPAGVVAGGEVMAVGGVCPPCVAPGGTGVVMPASYVEGGGQTPPCPSGP